MDCCDEFVEDEFVVDEIVGIEVYEEGVIGDEDGVESCDNEDVGCEGDE